MKKRIILGLVLSIFLVLILNNVSAWSGGTLTCGSSTTFNTAGVNFINFSITGGNNVTNCTAIMKSSLTGNSSFTIINTNIRDIFNGTQQSNGSVIMNTTNKLEDSNDYQAQGYCVNITDSKDFIANCTALTSREIEFTAPDTPTSLSPSNTKNADVNVEFSSTVAGTTTTSCELRFPRGNPGSNSYTMTHSANSCSYTINNMPEGLFYYTITASDETNTSTSDEVYIDHDIVSGSGKVIGQLTQAGFERTTDEKGKTVFVKEEKAIKPLSIFKTISENKVAGVSTIIWIVVLSLVIGYFIYKGKKNQ